MIVIRPWNGKPITEAGVYSGIPIETYHSHTICAPDVKISSSGLKTIIGQSPAHYWKDSAYNPRRAERKDKRELTLGSAAHAILVGGEIFSERFIIRPEQLLNAETNKMRKWHGNNLECKAWLTAHRGREVLTEDDLVAVRGMAISLGRHPMVQAGALNGHIEMSMFWRDQRSGLWLSARPDVIPNDSGDYVDLKTARSVQYFALQGAIYDYGYIQQAGLVAEGASALGLPFESFTLAFVESDDPYCSRLVSLRDEDIARGAKLNRLALDSFADCIAQFGLTADAVWPGPGADRADAEFIDLSDRVRERIDERVRLPFSMERQCSE